MYKKWIQRTQKDILLIFLSLRKAVILGFETDYLLHWYFHILLPKLFKSTVRKKLSPEVSQIYYIRTIGIQIGKAYWDLEICRNG